MFKKSALRVFLIGSASALMLSASACTWLEDWPPAEHGGVFTPQTETVMPEPTVVQTAQGTWLQQPAQQQAVPVRTQEQKIKDLEQARKERDAALARLSALEGQMAQMQENMQTLVPAMNQLAQAQTEMQSDLQKKQQMEAELETQRLAEAQAQQAAKLAEEEAAKKAAQQAAMQDFKKTMEAHAAMQKAPSTHTAVDSDVIMGDGMQDSAGKSAAPQMASTLVSAPTSGVMVKEFRAGDGSDRTRLVFETNGSVSYDYDLDNSEGLMVLTLSNVQWKALPEKIFGEQALLSSYKAVQNNDGSTSIIMQLKRPVKVEWAKMFTPAAGTPYRLILDVAAR